MGREADQLLAVGAEAMGQYHEPFGTFAFGLRQHGTVETEGLIQGVAPCSVPDDRCGLSGIVR